VEGFDESDLNPHYTPRQIPVFARRNEDVVQFVSDRLAKDTGNGDWERKQTGFSRQDGGIVKPTIPLQGLPSHLNVSDESALFAPAIDDGAAHLGLIGRQPSYKSI